MNNGVLDIKISVAEGKQKSRQIPVKRNVAGKKKEAGKEDDRRLITADPF